jgi:hypothetical protein
VYNAGTFRVHFVYIWRTRKVPALYFWCAPNVHEIYTRGYTCTPIVPPRGGGGQRSEQREEVCHSHRPAVLVVREEE